MKMREEKPNARCNDHAVYIIIYKKNIKDTTNFTIRGLQIDVTINVIDVSSTNNK